MLIWGLKTWEPLDSLTFDPMSKKIPVLDYISQSRLLSHFLFWSVLYSVFVILATVNSGSFVTSVANYMGLFPLQIIAAYLLNYYQVPQLLLRKKYWAFGISLFISIYIFSALGRISIVYLVEPLVREDFVQESIAEIFQDTAYLFSAYFPAVYIYALVMLLIKAFKRRFEEKHHIEILQKEKATNELKFLRAQIQPHFLFNTLNNLYALTLSKSDLAPEVVLKLSEILDFILYQSDKPTIPITKEIELIEAFIELETLRHGDSLACSFTKELSDPTTQIAPLLLLPLVENAFKHGTSKSKKAEINLHLKVDQKNIDFSISNSRNGNIPYKSISSSGSGIGIVNLKRQLSLNYPDRHDLQIESNDSNYSVVLNLIPN